MHGDGIGAEDEEAANIDARGNPVGSPDNFHF